MKRTLILLFSSLFIICLLAAGCSAEPGKPQTANPDAAAIAGDWLQMFTVESMPQKLSFTQNGMVSTGKAAGQWKFTNEKLNLRIGGQETVYDYTVAGYMLTLVNNNTDTSSFYISPALFSQKGDDNNKFLGQWAAYSSYATLLFDGQDKLDEVSYDSTQGKTIRSLKYTARDGILQATDDAGNAIYNLYSFLENELRLAETTEYDKDDKQWTSYSKKAETTALNTRWKRVLSLTAADAPDLPEVVEFQPGEKGTLTKKGGSPVQMRWEYYADGFVLLKPSDYELQYAYVTTEGPTLFLSNSDESLSWYVNDTFSSALSAPKELAGVWKIEEPSVEWEFAADGTLTAKLDGKQYSGFATAAGYMLAVSQGGKTYYIAFQHDEDTLYLNYTGVPFLPADTQSLQLTKQ